MREINDEHYFWQDSLIRLRGVHHKCSKQGLRDKQNHAASPVDQGG